MTDYGSIRGGGELPSLRHPDGDETTQEDPFWKHRPIPAPLFPSFLCHVFFLSAFRPRKNNNPQILMAEYNLGRQGEVSDLPAVSLYSISSSFDAHYMARILSSLETHFSRMISSHQDRWVWIARYLFAFLINPAVIAIAIWTSYADKQLLVEPYSAMAALAADIVFRIAAMALLYGRYSFLRSLHQGSFSVATLRMLRFGHWSVLFVLMAFMMYEVTSFILSLFDTEVSSSLVVSHVVFSMSGIMIGWAVYFFPLTQNGFYVFDTHCAPLSVANAYVTSGACDSDVSRILLHRCGDYSLDAGCGSWVTYLSGTAPLVLCSHCLTISWTSDPYQIPVWHALHHLLGLVELLHRDHLPATNLKPILSVVHRMVQNIIEQADEADFTSDIDSLSTGGGGVGGGNPDPHPTRTQRTRSFVSGGEAGAVSAAARAARRHIRSIRTDSLQPREVTLLVDLLNIQDLVDVALRIGFMATQISASVSPRVLHALGQATLTPPVRASGFRSTRILDLILSHFPRLPSGSASPDVPFDPVLLGAFSLLLSAASDMQLTSLPDYYSISITVGTLYAWAHVSQTVSEGQRAKAKELLRRYHERAGHVVAKVDKVIAEADLRPMNLSSEFAHTQGHFSASVNLMRWKRSAFPVVVKQVAVSSIDDVSVFLSEVENLFRLDHPHVVRLLGIVPPFGIVLEAMTGDISQLWAMAGDLGSESGGGLASSTSSMGSTASSVQSMLQAQLAAVIRVTPQIRLSIALQIAYALEHLHSKGSAHCDVKSANILFQVHGFNNSGLGGEGGHGMVGEVVVKLSDFGLSTVKSRGASSNLRDLTYLDPALVPSNTPGAGAPQASRRVTDVFGSAASAGASGVMSSMDSNVSASSSLSSSFHAALDQEVVSVRARKSLEREQAGDVFSFGIVLWEVFHVASFSAAAASEWGTSSAVTILRSHASGRRLPIRLEDENSPVSYAVGITDLITRCWEPRWQRRPSMAECVLILRTFYDNL